MRGPHAGLGWPAAFVLPDLAEEVEELVFLFGRERCSGNFIAHNLRLSVGSVCLSKNGKKLRGHTAGSIPIQFSKNPVIVA